MLLGKELLFLIRAGSGLTYKRKPIYEVLRICHDPEIMKMFSSGNLFTTPAKVQHVLPFITNYLFLQFFLFDY